MSLSENPPRVLLSAPEDGDVVALNRALTHACMIVTQIDAPLDAVRRQAVALSPDVVVLWRDELDKEELRFIRHILEQTRSGVVLILGQQPMEGLELPGDERIALHIKSKIGRGGAAGYAAVAVSVIEKSWAHKRTGATDGSGDRAAHGTAAVTAEPPSNSTVKSVPGAISQTVLKKDLIAIGASTGGTEALSKFFHMLPPAMPGIVVVQHMPPVFTKMYAMRLNEELPFNVCEAEDNVQIVPGSIHIAPGGRHLMVKRRGSAFYTQLGNEEKVSGHCPSVDVLFQSVADEVGAAASGVILTGMGADGASGLLAMRRKGAFTIGQDEASSVVYGMPRKAFECGAVVKQAPLNEIAQMLVKHLSKKKN